MNLNNWKKVKLGEVCSIRRGSSPRPIKDYLSDAGMPWVKIADATESNSRFINKTNEFIKIEGVGRSVVVEPGALILSNSGTAGLPKFMGIKACIHDGWQVFDDLNGIDKNYLYYVLLFIRERLLHGAYDSTMKNLTLDMVRGSIIWLPPVEEQKHISRYLNCLDDKIELNNNIIQKLEDMAQTIYKQWFIDFEFPNVDGEPYKTSGGEMVNSEHGLIPKGWEVNTLDKIVELSTKSVNPQKHPERLFEHYSIPALDDGKMPEMHFGEEIKSNKYIISDKVVLISKLNPTTKRIWKPFPQGKYPICSTEFMVYTPKEEKTISYVYELINSDAFSEMLVSHATGSTGSRQRVKPSNTLKFKYTLPSFDIMNKFSKVIEPIHEIIALKINENKKISTLRDTLIPKLMSGEIRVPLGN